VAVHRVLIQGYQQVDAVTHIRNSFGTCTNRQKGVAATDNRLIGIVGVQVQPTATEDLGENVARRGHTLTGGASNTDSEGLPHGVISQLKPTEPQ
jgi:hypothetical protein